MLEKRPSDDIIRKELFSGRDYQFELEGYNYSEYPDQDSVSLDVEVQFTNFSTIADNQLVFSPMVYWSKRNPFQKQRRSFPVDFNYPVTFTDVVDVSLDPGVKIVGPLQDVRETINGISFNRSTIAAGNAMKVMSQLAIGRPVYGADYYTQIRNIFERISQAASDAVTASM
jgi:hypothetical protein